MKEFHSSRQNRGRKVISDEVLTVKETANYLKIGVSSLYRLIEKNQGPRAIRLGRTIRFRWSTLKAFMDEQDGGSL